MDGTPREPKDRPFKPCKTQQSHEAKQYAEAFLAEVSATECRKRARRADDLSNHIAMCSALALDLAHRELSEPRGWLSVSLQKAQYSPQMRPAPFLTESFIELVKLVGGHNNFVELRLGGQGALGPAKRTTIRAGVGLRNLIDGTGLCLSDIGRDPRLRSDPIVIKGRKVMGKARKLRVPDSEQARTLRAQIVEINDWLAGADLSWDEAEGKVDIGERLLRRVFNNGSFGEGGRLFGGFWQNAKRDVRMEALSFGEDGAVALDFGQMAVRSAYSMQNKEPPAGDLYAVPGLEGHRKGVKGVLNALLACDAIPKRFPQGTRRLFLGRSCKFVDVLGLIAKHHPDILPLFGTSQSLRLMNLESNLLVSILLRLKAARVVALPIHDCVLVGESNVGVTQQVMEEAFKEFLGMDAVLEVTRPIPKFTVVSPIEGGVRK